jgi:hypothetical protein
MLVRIPETTVSGFSQVGKRTFSPRGTCGRLLSCISLNSNFRSKPLLGNLISKFFPFWRGEVSGKMAESLGDLLEQSSNEKKPKVLPDGKTWMFFAVGDEFTFLGVTLGGKEIMLGVKSVKKMRINS